jgi:phosphoribosylformimino-5-aminoimidazole carboxamide ribotide isomerase
MRIIPVMDLQNGLAVHAVKGDRANYKPVTSVLCRSSNPLDLARTFRDSLGAKELYIADLDSIQNNGKICHRKVIDVLSQEENIAIILDAGVSDVADIQLWLKLGIHKIIVGSETLHDWNSIQKITSIIDPARLIFSLDSSNGKILTQCPVLAQMSPLKILEHIQSAGWQEIILLDLRRVGSNQGADHGFLISVRNYFPNLKLLAGGGITGPEELSALASLGTEGVLVATALHNGNIQTEHFRIFS